MGSIGIFQLLIILVLLPLVFLPTIIAIKKKHPHRIPIILVNVFGGLVAGSGWLIALIWCFIEPSKTSTIDVASQIEKLHKLKEKGILTQDEFDMKKKALL
ncbi:superinfection immunity protein [Shewanella sp. MTB7]|uniref:superinfection immunity protein n=1 Tax=Shewanella sp. MTB7 TaxID=2746932 RepID=UPI0022BA14C1|nr:superinfection immunity protein [Shewanella sp. MTB7]WBJ96699.1 superinfection immunity protein [Shewanella sp. MTB7]